MSLTKSLKKIFFLTNLNKNQPEEISKINISLSKNKYKRTNKSIIIVKSLVYMTKGIIN